MPVCISQDVSKLCPKIYKADVNDAHRKGANDGACVLRDASINIPLSTDFFPFHGVADSPVLQCVIFL